jgi:hypothetical protein
LLVFLALIGGSSSWGQSASRLFRDQKIRTAFHERCLVLLGHAGWKSSGLVYRIKLKALIEVGRRKPAKCYRVQTALPYGRMEGAGAIEKMVNPIEPRWRQSGLGSDTHEAPKFGGHRVFIWRRDRAWNRRIIFSRAARIGRLMIVVEPEAKEIEPTMRQVPACDGLTGVPTKRPLTIRHSTTPERNRGVESRDLTARAQASQLSHGWPPRGFIRKQPASASAKFRVISGNLKGFEPSIAHHRPLCLCFRSASSIKNRHGNVSDR